ncbi:MAG: acyl-CoA carboxylase subunit beta, partial [Saprospiraceae bacterium]
MDPKELEFLQNEDAMKLAMSSLEYKLDVILLGGGKVKLAKLKKEGKLPPRERISTLIDPGSEFFEIGAFAGYEMYP